MKRVLDSLKNGTIVKVGQRYGVVEGVPERGKWRTVDFWDGGREWVPTQTLVEVMK